MLKLAIVTKAAQNQIQQQIGLQVQNQMKNFVVDHARDGYQKIIKYIFGAAAQDQVQANQVQQVQVNQAQQVQAQPNQMMERQNQINIQQGRDLESVADQELLQRELFLKNEQKAKGKDWWNLKNLEKTAASAVRVIGTITWQKPFALAAIAYGTLSLWNKPKWDEKASHELLTTLGKEIAIGLAPSAVAFAAGCFCPLVPGIAFGVNLALTTTSFAWDYYSNEYGFTQAISSCYSTAQEAMTPKQKKEFQPYSKELLMAVYREASKQPNGNYLLSLIKLGNIDKKILKKIWKSTVDTKEERKEISEQFERDYKDGSPFICDKIILSLQKIYDEYKEELDEQDAKKFCHQFFINWNMGLNKIDLDNLTLKQIQKMKYLNHHCLKSLFDQLIEDMGPAVQEIKKKVDLKLEKLSLELQAEEQNNQEKFLLQQKKIDLQNEQQNLSQAIKKQGEFVEIFKEFKKIENENQQQFQWQNQIQKENVEKQDNIENQENLNIKIEENEKQQNNLQENIVQKENKEINLNIIDDKEVLPEEYDIIYKKEIFEENEQQIQTIGSMDLQQIDLIRKTKSFIEKKKEILLNAIEIIFPLRQNLAQKLDLDKKKEQQALLKKMNQFNRGVNYAQMIENIEKVEMDEELMEFELPQLKELMDQQIEQYGLNKQNIDLFVQQNIQNIKNPTAAQLKQCYIEQINLHALQQTGLDAKSKKKNFF